MEHDQPSPVGSASQVAQQPRSPAIHVTNQITWQQTVHTDHSSRHPGEQPHLLVISPTSFWANPKSAVSSTLVDAITKPHLACANTNMNVSSATAITLRPHVPTRTPINKHKLDTPLCHYTITLIVRLLNHCLVTTSRFQSWLHWCTLLSFIFQPKVRTRAQGYCSARA